MEMSALCEFVKRGSELASATVPAILAFTLLIFYRYCPAGCACITVRVQKRLKW
jgi:hypothetical protein